MERSRIWIIATVVVVILGGVFIFMKNKSTSTAEPMITASGLNVEQDAGTVTEVEIKDSLYTPYQFSVKNGASITIKNNDSTAHTFTDIDGNFDTGTIAAGKSKTITFNKIGSFIVTCTLHPEMRAAVTVIE